jgi:hypothetical protein
MGGMQEGPGFHGEQDLSESKQYIAMDREERPSFSVGGRFVQAGLSQRLRYIHQRNFWHP